MICLSLCLYYYYFFFLGPWISQSSALLLCVATQKNSPQSRLPLFCFFFYHHFSCNSLVVLDHFLTLKREERKKVPVY
ncbi:hypothetical protein BGW37DRAFT_213562 [Umbelopsis sp. PMI_123]|nr:hypothetical protein BGW37DRAFT_213562 [Umbelopsis sp. PMI_123]